MEKGTEAFSSIEEKLKSTQTFNAKWFFCFVEPTIINFIDIWIPIKYLTSYDINNKLE
jgi:hypothetical protein